MSLPLLGYTIEMFGIVACLLMGISVLIKQPRHKTAQLFAALCFSLLCFFIKTRQEYSYGATEGIQLQLGALLLPMKLAMNSFSGLLMLFIFSLFQEGKKFPLWLIMAFVLQLILEGINVIYFTENFSGVISASAMNTYFHFNMLPALLQLLFSVCSVYWTMKDWQVDLVAQRRHLRWLFIVFQCFWSFAVTFAYKFLVPLDEQSGFIIHSVIVTLKAVFAFGLALIVLNFDFSLLGNLAFDNVQSTRKQSAEKTVEKELKENQAQDWKRDWARFTELFIGQKMYLETGLSVASLALKLSVPEYRLRNLINQNLGYRNFNSMLHEYRIAEACEMLSDAKQASLPILTIALSIGYQSINPFNKAFRDIKGMTPSQFRKGVPS